MNEIHTTEIPLDYFILTKTSDGKVSLKAKKAVFENKIASVVIMIALYLYYGHKYGYGYWGIALVLMLAIMFLVRTLFAFFIEAQQGSIQLHFRNVFVGSNIEEYTTSEMVSMEIKVRSHLLSRYQFKYRGKVFINLQDGKKVTIYRSYNGEKPALLQTLRMVAKEFSEVMGVRVVEGE